jgi:two-component system nitrogen regulation response regulator NtrX
LIEHFNSKFSRAYGKKPKTFDADALDALQNHIWLGNVRELRNTIERVVIMVSGENVSRSDLPEFGSNGEIPASTFRFPSFKDATDAYQREFILHKLAESDGNVSKAAEEMGVDRSHLYRRMKNLGIQGK